MKLYECTPLEGKGDKYVKKRKQFTPEVQRMIDCESIFTHSEKNKGYKERNFKTRVDIGKHITYYTTTRPKEEEPRRRVSTVSRAEEPRHGSYGSGLSEIEKEIAKEMGLDYDDPPKKPVSFRGSRSTVRKVQKIAVAVHYANTKCVDYKVCENVSNVVKNVEYEMDSMAIVAYLKTENSLVLRRPTYLDLSDIYGFECDRRMSCNSDVMSRNVEWMKYMFYQGCSKIMGPGGKEKARVYVCTSNEKSVGNVATEKG